MKQINKPRVQLPAAKIPPPKKTYFCQIINKTEIACQFILEIQPTPNLDH